MEKKMIWYLCYGSNLSYERFMRYINKCRDTTPPTESRMLIIHNKLYFAGNSITWSNKATAYIEPIANPSITTYARIYKITAEQYLEVKKQEGKKYEREVKFPNIDGLPCVSFTETTGRNLLRHNDIDKKYLDTIFIGLIEMGINRETARNYLNNIVCENH